MLEGLKRKQPGSPLRHVIFYEMCAFGARVLLRLFFRARVHHAERVPAEGACLIAANHQSYLDPPLIAIWVRQRHLNFIARSGLFKSKPFAMLIAYLNSIPIREDAGDAGAIKEVLRRLDQRQAVLIFPEGSRTPDGRMHEFKRGVALLVKRSKCPVVPVAVEGVHEAWGRGRAPRPFGCPIEVAYGEPISHEELMKDGADAALERLAREIAVLRAGLAEEIRRRTKGKYPRADVPSA